MKTNQFTSSSDRLTRIIKEVDMIEDIWLQQETTELTNSTATKPLYFQTWHHRNVYVCTGPLYLPKLEADGKSYIKYQVIGKNNVAVPTHFFKVIVMESDNQKLDMEAYVMPNAVIKDDTPLNVFQVPPESIERAAGLLFFDKISRSKLNKINGRWA
ncbi:endonuclease G, mitochondrial isoform X2 [Neocloeon triangulifer]|uniref:endonuclease G, mitochondrial isoform X2 n=1 Tax=Neocloeon triangulifer TaxID=2078957 RepID=UPI00286F1C90|nr:endonuclease G, mitochondrial isoform X2 [Neocloeon triangulifer]